MSSAPSKPPKKRQHYVWQHYLSAWESDGTVKCWQDGRVFASSTKNLGVESYFYALRDLKDHDDALIRALIAACDPHLRPIAAGWHEVFSAPSQLAKAMGSWPDVLGKSPDGVLAAAAELEEELHCLVEAQGSPLVASLRSGTVPTPSQMLELVPFLTTQYTRTKAIEEAVARTTSGQTRRIWQVMRHVFASNMAIQILRTGEFKADLLQAPGDHRFITGDQPIINLQAIWNAPGVDLTQLELYYPLSPTSALLVSKKASWVARPVTPFESTTRNASMAKAAHAQVYGATQSDLEHVTSDRSVGEELTRSRSDA